MDVFVSRSIVASMQDKSTYFAFTDYTFSPLEKKIAFNYEIGFEGGAPQAFTETVLLPAAPDVSGLPEGLIERLLEDVHLMLGISYYKLYCPPEIKLRKPISRTRAAFWNAVYTKGLGEFAYRNNLDLRERIRFPFADAQEPRLHDLARRERALIGIGGGKDSIVAIELLKEQKYPCDGFIVETNTSHDVAEKICEVAGIGSLKIRRLLDEKLFKPTPDTYAGHIPISAVYAFLGVLSAALYDYRYVVVGNEHSSNFGNVEHNGDTVNHQWSKSAEFEALISRHLDGYLAQSITYFSIARPFYEIRIAELFAKYPEYFPYFTGCNRKFKIDEQKRPDNLWCCECPKCAFIFLALAPFLGRDEVIKIFGRDMLDDPALLPLFKDILGFGNLKPFDCVGTFEEAQAALYMAGKTFMDSVAMKSFFQKIEDGEKLVKKTMGVAQALTVPTRFRFCGMKNALILGYGKEGEVTKRYLERTYPKLSIGIADASTDVNYLDTQDDYDIVVKTPGIAKTKVRAQYVTATNIFLAQARNPIIGVTGSKGKSTTASLIRAILLEAGIKARLAGNIGAPMLGLLEDKLGEKEIIVVELSSYQLDDIEFSPHIAVVTNLFPEHMDYHDGTDEYYRAKKNIIRFQKKDDVFVYNPQVTELQQWAHEARGSALPFSKELPFGRDGIHLLGEHNVDNVRAAVAVARLLNVPDECIERAVRNFKGLPHRLEFVGEFKSIRFYDDAISTTPESTIMALRAVPNIGTIFLGGFDRGYDFSALEKEIRTRGVKNIVLFPETGKRMLSDRSGFNILETSDMKDAVAFAYANTSPGAACILSCASPSYGIWKNFEEKGDEFQEAVKEL